MVKILKLKPHQKSRVLELVNDEKKLNEYLMTLIDLPSPSSATKKTQGHSSPAVETKPISRSREIQESQLLAVASLTTLH